MFVTFQGLNHFSIDLYHCDYDCCQAHRGLPVGIFSSDIQFYVLLSPCLCSISFLYLDLYVLGDDA